MASINQQTLYVQSEEVQQADVIKHHVPQTGFVREGVLELSIITIAKCVTWIYSNMRKLYADVVPYSLVSVHLCVSPPPPF